MADSDEPVVLAIDGNSLVHRSFHAQARTGQLTDDGRPTWAVRGLLMQLVAAVERIRPSAVVIGFDDPDSSTRRERWPEYKAHRVDKLETLVDQLSAAAAVMRELGVCVVVPAGLEADDVLASTAAYAKRVAARTVIMTSDRDAFALIDDTTRVLRIINGGVDASPLMTAARLELLLGIRPEQYRDYAALRGDPSDNLPGVRGVGPRTAARLLQQLGQAQRAFDDLDAVRVALGAGIAARLCAAGARKAWQRNCQVMTMHTDVAIELDLAAGPGVLPLDAEAVRAAFAAQHLTWTAKDALRVLAGLDAEAEADAGPVVPRHAALPSWVRGATGGSRGPLPKLPARRPEPAQLSLF